LQAQKDTYAGADTEAHSKAMLEAYALSAVWSDHASKVRDLKAEIRSMQDQTTQTMARMWEVITPLGPEFDAIATKVVHLVSVICEPGEDAPPLPPIVLP
jgi:hypothetical protein